MLVVTDYFLYTMSQSPDYKVHLNKLESLLDEYFGQKAPAMPDNIKETLVSFAPYLAIIGVVLGLPAILAVLGLGALFAPFSLFLGPLGAMRYSMMYVIGAVVMAAALVFEVLAIPGLFKRTLGAWRFMYYSTLISLVGSLLQGSVSGFIVGGLVGFYILFQLKGKYK